MKNIKKNWISFLGFQIVVLLIATFVDLSLSHKVFSTSNAFGFILELFGEIPLTIMGTAAALYKGLSYAQRDGKKISMVTHFLLAGLFSLMSGFQIPHYLNAESFTVPVIVITSAMLLIVGFLVNKLPKNNDKLIRFASLVIFVAFMNIIVINVIKQFWGRERYRHMVANNNYDGFSKWFIPQGMAAGEEFKSFPSGHSANASIIMLLALYPFKDIEMQNKVFPFVAFYTTLVQFSRIIQGAHFLSDVTTGVILGLIIIYVGTKLFLKEDVSK